MAIYFYQYFQIFSIFMCNRSLPTKSFQFFKSYKPFGKKREKTLIQQSTRKEKLRKVILCSITDCFTKRFERVINHFLYFACSFAAQFLLFEVRMTQEIHSFFYKHTGKLGWSSVCLRFSQFQPEIMLDGMLNFKNNFMVWYSVWYEHCNGLFNNRNLVSSLILMF